MSIDTLCRLYLHLPSIFKKIPDLKFLFKRFQIYDLIVRGLTDYAKTLYKANFKYLINLREFKEVNSHFNVIFSNAKSRNIIIENYFQMREDFYDKIENLLLDIMEKEHSVIFEKDYKNTFISYCLPNELKKYELLSIEYKLINLIVKETIQIDYENTDLEFINNAMEDSEFNRISNRKESYSNNNLIAIYNNNANKNNSLDDRYEITVNDVYDIIGVNESSCPFSKNCDEGNNPKTVSYFVLGNKNLAISYFYNQIPRLKVQLDPFSNRSMLVKSYQITTYNDASVSKFLNFRDHNEFLRNFSPKFMKRESIDKIIIRRLRKFAIYFLEEKGIKYVTKKDKKIIVDKYSNSSLIFIINFAYSNYIPPFTYRQIMFKSYNTNYLVWLFSDNSMCSLYEMFSMDIGDELYNKTVREYDLLEKEASICQKLKHYIKNYNKIYNINNANENHQLQEKFDINKLSYGNFNVNYYNNSNNNSNDGVIMKFSNSNSTSFNQLPMSTKSNSKALNKTEFNSENDEDFSSNNLFRIDIQLNDNERNIKALPFLKKNSRLIDDDVSMRSIGRRSISIREVKISSYSSYGNNNEDNYDYDYIYNNNINNFNNNCNNKMNDNMNDIQALIDDNENMYSHDNNENNNNYNNDEYINNNISNMLDLNTQADKNNINNSSLLDNSVITNDFFQRIKKNNTYSISNY